MACDNCVFLDLCRGVEGLKGGGLIEVPIVPAVGGSEALSRVAQSVSRSAAGWKCQLDRELNIVTSSHHVVELLGVRPEAMQGQSLLRFVVPEKRRLLETMLKRTALGEYEGRKELLRLPLDALHEVRNVLVAVSLESDQVLVEQVYDSEEGVERRGVLDLRRRTSCASSRRGSREVPMLRRSSSGSWGDFCAESPVDRTYTIARDLRGIFGDQVDVPGRIYWFVNVNGQIEEVSTAGARSMLKISPSALLGKHILSTVAVDDRATLERQFASPQEGQVFRMPLRRVDTDGRPIQVEVIGTFITIHGGEKKWVFCDTPLTRERKELYRDPDLMAAADLEYDIRQPCQVLTGSAELMRELVMDIVREPDAPHPLKAKAWRLLHVTDLMRTENRMLSNLVDNFALWEDLRVRGLDGWEEKKERFVIFERIKTVLRDQRRRAEDSHVAFEQRIEFSESEVLGIPELAIDRVLGNLFEHIFRCMNLETRGRNAIALSSRERSDGEGRVLLEIKVIASGPGIVQDHRKRAFIPYALEGDYRLPVVGKIIHLLGGSITLDESDEPGIVFVLRIPFDLGRVSVQSERSEVSSGASRSTVASVVAPTASEAPRYRVAFADDRPGQRAIVSEWLDRKGFQKEICDDGRAVVEKVRAGERYDAYVLDYRMRDLNGVETARQLRELGVTAPIILISGVSHEINEKELSLAGVNELWKKPVSIKKLLAHVRELISVGASR